jgi:hypothetical protein
MPQLIKHIDAIAREKQRTVLYLEFHPESIFTFSILDDESESYDYQNDNVRDEIITNLDNLGIPWTKCAHIASPNLMCAYLGQVYLDVPFDKDLPLYQTLETYLEYPDGSMRFPSVRFGYLPLEMAMKNAHHDEPGFWENWAENF